MYRFCLGTFVILEFRYCFNSDLQIFQENNCFDWQNNLYCSELDKYSF